MKIKSFKSEMYKCIIDSEWVEVEPLTVLVGKNESGKTSLLKCLHKINPFEPDPYKFDEEWPRGHRKERNLKKTVCSTIFELEDNEVEELTKIAGKKYSNKHIELSKDYEGNIEINFKDDLFPDSLHPNEVDTICQELPQIDDTYSENYRKAVEKLIKKIHRLAKEGRYSEMSATLKDDVENILTIMNAPGTPQRQKEESYKNQINQKIVEIIKILNDKPSIRKRAHDYIVSNLPTFIYMSDYKAFEGTALLNQVLDRKNVKKLTDADKTLLMLFSLSGLDLDEEVKRANITEKEQRQYDLDDASATLTREISDRWKQRKYEVEFRADGHSFYTFVKDDKDPSLIKLEERSKGFQWFFSFDLMFMHESKGTFKNCILLLDEPGLHLHPEAQNDLLDRLEAYAENNTLIYTTHLPFMIDVRKPERIRIINETEKGTKVTTNLTDCQPEAKLVLQAALGIKGSSSYLLSNKNLVVEGVHDFWFITEISRISEIANNEYLSEEIFITPSGGASEVVYISTFMIGQNLEVFALFDSDKSGIEGRDKLVKNWLTKYKNVKITAKCLNEIIDTKKNIYTIEDFILTNYYIEKVKEIYAKQLSTLQKEFTLKDEIPILNQLEQFFEENNIFFNKGSIAKIIKKELSKITNIEDVNKIFHKEIFELVKAINEYLMK